MKLDYVPKIFLWHLSLLALTSVVTKYNIFLIGDVGFDDRELLREASNIEDSLFQTPAPIGDASTLAAADESSTFDTTLTHQEKMVANDGFGDDDDDDVGALGR